MKVGYFRKQRRKRVIQLGEDLDFGINRVMRERWDFLSHVAFYQNLEELESLIQKNNILEKNSVDRILLAIEKIKKDYPVERKPLSLHGDFNNFMGEVLLLSGEIKKVILLPSDSASELPAHNPTARAWRILDGFFTAAEKRRETMEEEEKRLTTFIMIASKKHVYYMQMVINILAIGIGIVIGWIFSR